MECLDLQAANDISSTANFEKTESCWGFWFGYIKHWKICIRVPWSYMNCFKTNAWYQVNFKGKSELQSVVREGNMVNFKLGHDLKLIRIMWNQYSSFWSTISLHPNSDHSIISPYIGHFMIKHTGHENKGTDHQRWPVMIAEQILPTCTVRHK